MSKTLIIEPFYGGSHKQLIDTIISVLNPDDYLLITMSAKKWPWRARCGSLYISQRIPEVLDDFEILFCSSVLNLAELMGMCIRISRLKKIVYFHENQLIYPVQEIKARDIQYSYNQITTCISADKIVFNSKFNMNSFLDNIKKVVKIMPDYKLHNIPDIIKSKMSVLYFPLNFSKINSVKSEIEVKNENVLHIVWPHRWEFDKNPESFFHVLFKLKDEQIQFKLSVLGETYDEAPEIFTKAKDVLKENIVNFGYAVNVEDYYKILLQADIVVSTANHEFFGISMLEAVKCGCVPLVPNRLVYPEIYQAECLYNTDQALFEKLKMWCENPITFHQFKKDLNIDVDIFSCENLLPKYLFLLNK